MLPRKRSPTAILFILGLFLAAVGPGCNDGRPPRIHAGESTFINPIMQKWSSEYRIQRHIEIDYVGRGSGDGIEQMMGGTIDFGCSDIPLSRAQVAVARKCGQNVIHVPLILGAVAVAYNLPGVERPIRMTGDILADVFLKEITRWDHPRILALNPGMPAKDIVVVARAERSGTTYFFTEYLSKVSNSFRAAIGPSTKPKWPRGVLLQEQNDGVAGFVRNNEFTIGYVEVLFARKNNLGTVNLMNRAARFVGPDNDAVVAAGEEAVTVKATEEPYSLHDLTYSLTDAPGEKSYPICGVSYGILFERLAKDSGPPLVEFLKWAASEGQQFAGELDYAPLPAKLQKLVRERLERITIE
jgi:phosphate transport system substrate-binding protein